MAFCDGGYTTNVPVADLVGGKGMVAFRYGGADLHPEHGGPARLLCRTCISGSRPSGCGACALWRAISRAFGKRVGITCMEIPGASSGTGMIDPMTEPVEAHKQRIEWRWADVVETVVETPTVKSLVLRIEGWPGHRPGQHVDVRLTAEDGYEAQRSYSIASAPTPDEPQLVVLTVERLAEGEVSPFLTDEVRPGDKLEVRGPIGSYFTWTVADGGPLLLVAGGSGIVPLMSMLRHRAEALRKARVPVPALLLYSSRGYAEIIYRDELERLAAMEDGLRVVHTLTRGAPAEWAGYRRRIDRAMLAEVAPEPALRPQVFVCGPTPLVEFVASTLVELGHDPLLVRTERFGPTGG